MLLYSDFDNFNLNRGLANYSLISFSSINLKLSITLAGPYLKWHFYINYLFFRISFIECDPFVQNDWLQIGDFCVYLKISLFFFNFEFSSLLSFKVFLQFICWVFKLLMFINCTNIETQFILCRSKSIGFGLILDEYLALEIEGKCLLAICTGADRSELFLLFFNFSKPLLFRLFLKNFKF